MAATAVTGQPRSILNSLMVVNPMLGQKEGHEHEKVLYYDPPETPVHIQTRDAGLAAALIGFTKQFSPESPVDTVVTQKTVQVFHRAEPNLWLVLSVKRPGARDNSADAGAKKGKRSAAERSEPDGGDADGCVPPRHRNLIYTPTKLLTSSWPLDLSHVDGQCYWQRWQGLHGQHLPCSMGVHPRF